MGKRAAAKSSAPPAKAAKAAKDPNEADYKSVTRGLKMDAGIPYNVVEMLNEMMPGSLGVPKEERHSIQSSIVEMYETLLGQVEKNLKKELGEVEEAIGGLGPERSRREAAAQAAEADKAAKITDREAKKHALAEVARAFQEAKSRRQSAVAEAQAGDKEAVRAASRLEELQRSLSEAIEPLSAGTVAAEEIHKVLSSLVQTLTVYGFDKSLLTSIPNAISKPPAERGQFDVVVVEQLQAETKKRISSLRQLVEQSEPEKRRRAERVELAEKELAAAQEKQIESADAFTSAQNAGKDADHELDVRNVALVSLDSEAEKLQRKRETLQNRLQAFQEKQLGSLRKLSTLSAAATEPAEPVESA